MPTSPPASHSSVISGIPVRHFYPPDSNPSSLPLVFFIHGGGWTHRYSGPTGRFANELANAIPAEVIAIDYTVSPEAPPGLSIQECQTVWNAISPGRIAFIGGDSAGGNISSGLMFKLIENGNLPVGLFLIYPASELHDLTPAFSMKRFRRGYGMDDDEKAAYVSLYVPDKEMQTWPLYSAVEGDVSGWPLTLVITAQFDVLRDMGRKLAKKLQEVGKLVRYKCLQGAIHACVSRPGLDESRKEVVDEVKRFVDLLK
jgi:acetyl esterase